MPETTEPISVWQGEMVLSGITLHLHVLSDGTRIIEADGLAALLAAWEAGAAVDEGEAAAFACWQQGGGI